MLDLIYFFIIASEISKILIKCVDLALYDFIVTVCSEFLLV